MTYTPALESVQQHSAPTWLHDAKLGIFVHWGLYSLPGWAPTTGPLPEVVASEGWNGWFGRNPYAEWYMNSIRIAGSSSAQYHAATYGADFAYEQFAPMFNEAVRKWDPSVWAELFAEAGARYVVLTTKHHDGFLLWPSAQPNPFKAGYHAERDLVGDLAAAVRMQGMRMGLYYSGGLDWTFNDRVIADLPDLFHGVPQSEQYAAYATAHWRELIERYGPAVMWNDIGYPYLADLPELFAFYYNQLPDGAINDRFTQVNPANLPRDPSELFTEGSLPAPAHFDFRTPEYTSYKAIVQQKWESTRGLGYSFGYNRNESVEDMLSPAELVRSFVDIVSKNGNLLINVGPTADGTIPSAQVERLQALGRWLRTNGAAIYGSRPWAVAESHTDDGIAVRFTQRDDAVYAILLDTPQQRRVVIESLVAHSNATVELLGHAGTLRWSQEERELAIELPDVLPDEPAHTLKITSVLHSA